MSSESDSDKDYVPGKPEQLSEEESADDDTEAQYEQEVNLNANKRKYNNLKQNGKRIKIQNTNNDSENDEKSELEMPLDRKLEKQREDDLWASFLEGTAPTKPKALSEQETNKKSEDQSFNESDKTTTIKLNRNTAEETKAREARIFEFAGETVVVEDNVIKQVTPISPNTPTGSKTSAVPLRGRGCGGLGDLLGQLNKKNKLSTLDKSKLDWDTFKKKEGIQEELQTFNKGKDGYLERQDFLERTDHRQFELERDLRTNKRSNR